ncbi:methyl-accepting chemotaxis protein [Rhodopseudomonas palustris]|uniref:Methyl-accepting chemotaxis protein n=1 Tax=Thiospirillum jenense TaxID=1653858 RepID=A0A839H561_9GAMM|nr:methyl-accepting chemotaxis protein [Thiospirillum jenense]MBB1089674.1 methyl-accepting chemotaxis protein [Rhodopseudomonas palustris]MBB1124774.1 methyl-accepting chemotaxis protein [Thiospirillum jenense]
MNAVSLSAPSFGIAPPKDIKKHFSLSAKVTTVSIITTLLFILILGGYIQYFRAQLIEQSSANLATSLQTQIDLSIQYKLDLLVTNAISITHSDSIIMALQADNVVLCERELQHLTDEFKTADFQGVRFHVIRADMTSFYRSFSTDRNDDVSFRAMLRQVATSKKPVAGVELGRESVALRAIAPVFDGNNKLIGMVETMMGVGSISRELRNQNSFYMLLVKRDVVDEAQFRAKAGGLEIGRNYFAANDKWFDADTIAFARNANDATLDSFTTQLTDDYFFAAASARTTDGKVYGIHLTGMPRAQYESNLKAVFELANHLLFGIIILLVVMTGLMLGLLRYLVVNPINALSTFLLNLGYDLTQRFHWTSRDEIGQISHSVNALLARLQHLLAQVTTEINAVVEASNTLNQVSRQVNNSADNTLQQTTSVATASEELSLTSNEIAHSCHVAVDNAAHVVSLTHDGFKAVRETVTGIKRRRGGMRKNAEVMTSLSERSKQIDSIVATIDEIAGQTNLLALNAAIEAARAGEMGRGFAVVADEVRALAGRTTQATKEINSMITAIQADTQAAMQAQEASASDAEKGAAQAEEMETMLHGTLAQVDQVKQQIDQIATAAEEQTCVTAEIANNLASTTHATERSAVAAAELAKSAHNLDGLADKLRRLIAQFQF